jgi:hypothetical protein
VAPDVLDFYETDELSLGVNILVLFGLIVVFRLIAYAILRRNGPVYDLQI